MGSASDSKVHVYTLEGTKLSPKTELEHLGPITDVAYSPDNNYLVACDANRKVILYSLPEYKVNLDLVNCLVVSFSIYSKSLLILLNVSIRINWILRR